MRKIGVKFLGVSILDKHMLCIEIERKKLQKSRSDTLRHILECYFAPLYAGTQYETTTRVVPEKRTLADKQRAYRVLGLDSTGG